VKVFAPLFERAIRWAAHPRATWLLALLSFIEAIFFPVMPEVMLAPMCIAKPKRGFWFAGISLLAGTLGALVGYELGHYAYEAVKPLLSTGMQAEIQQWVDKLQVMMREHRLALMGALLAAAIQPVIPMKLVTWGAGIAGVPLPEFIACVLIGRGKRLFLVAAAIRIGGERAAAALQRYIEPIGWTALVLLAGALAWLVLRHHGG
jgi:membrane protein YqaA with SNARE-associated domain